MQVEQVMIAFVESPERQHNLPAMPKAQREAAHQMAEAFGLITQSYGQEPNRHIRLIKVSRLLLRCDMCLSTEHS